MAIPFALTRLFVRTGLAQFLPRARRLTDGNPAVLRYLSDRVLAGPAEMLLDAATFPDVSGPDAVNLNLGAPRFDSPLSSTRTADRGGLPPAWGLPQLRQAIADQYRQRDRRSIRTADDVLVTHGASGAFAAVLDAVVNPGDRVALLAPSSPAFAIGAQSRRAKISWLPVESDAEGRAVVDDSALRSTMRSAKLFALADPGSPTGATFSPESLERLAWYANRFDVLVYLDETFARFRYDGSPCGLAAMPGAESRTLVAGSVTAGYGLASARVGWLTGPRPLVRACAMTANLAAPWPSTVGQQIALRAMQAEAETFAPVLESFRSRRKYTVDRLRGMGLEPTWPSAGFFCWVPVSGFGLDGRTFAERLLKEQRVLVGPGCAYGPGAESFVRVSFAAEDGRMREGLARLAAFVSGLKGGPVVHSATVSVPEDPTSIPKSLEDRAPAFSRV